MRLVIISGDGGPGGAWLSRILSANGFEIPYPSTAGHPRAPDGFFESQAVVDINRQALADVGGRGPDLPAFAILAALAFDRSARERCTRFLAELPHGRSIVLYDARMPWLLRSWMTAAIELGLHPELVVTCDLADAVVAYKEALFGPNRDERTRQLQWASAVLEGLECAREFDGIAVTGMLTAGIVNSSAQSALLRLLGDRSRHSLPPCPVTDLSTPVTSPDSVDSWYGRLYEHVARGDDAETVWSEFWPHLLTAADYV
ncbi:hypothetical protein [Nocardia asteroides]|uniref:hypothetical protein n=1 Tax=Nocardia asteroides TaxID=1824 RepID=UPI0036503773